MVEQLTKANIKDYRFFKAVDGKALERSEINYTTSYRSMKKGELGCYMSHLKVVKLCNETFNNYDLVLEDDAILCDNFIEKVKDLVKHAPKDWDIILLSTTNIWLKCINNGTLKLDKIQINKKLSKITSDHYGNQGYLVSKRAIGTMLYHEYPIKYPIDLFPTRIGLNVYIPNEEWLVTQRGGRGFRSNTMS